MKYDDLSFNVKYTNGEELICDITAVVPNDKSPDEPYVTYTDYSLDEKNNFRTYYGRIIMVDGKPVLSRELTKYEIIFIQDSLKDEIVKELNDALIED